MQQRSRAGETPASPRPEPFARSQCVDRPRAPYGARNYDPLPVVLAHGDGCWLMGRHGRRYLDMMSAYSAVSYGHAHPRIVGALVEQAQRLAVTSRAFHNDLLPLLLRAARARSPDSTARCRRTAAPKRSRPRSRPRASGVTRSRAFPTDRAEIIVCDGNFHGRSITIVGFSSEPQYRDGFGPFPPGFRHGSVRRRRGARARDHAEHRRVPGRADPGRGRHHRSARGLSRAVRARSAATTTCS